MKRALGLVIGLGFLSIGIASGVTLASDHPRSSAATLLGSIRHAGRINGASARNPGNSRPFGSGFGRGMMGSGMSQNSGNHARGYVGSGNQGLMGDMSGGSLWPAHQVAKIVQQSERGVSIDRATNTITYHHSHDLLVPLAAPASLHIKGMQWEIDGLINPRVVVPQGAQVTVDLVNQDKNYRHGFEVTTAKPPFNAMAMMQSSQAFPGSFIMPILPLTNQNQFHHQSTQFTATKRGAYYYICPVPGHAALGMAGQFVVN